MIIHLVRHAEAVERSAELPEEHRYLTSRGRTRFRKIATSLRKSGIDPDLIVTSPLIRAVQTAEILAQALKYKGELLVSPLLAHGFQQDKLLETIEGFPKAKEIALVGHEPEFGMLAGSFLEEKGCCTLDKGATISFKINVDGSAPCFKQLVDGGAKVIGGRSKALKRLISG